MIGNIFGIPDANQIVLFARDAAGVLELWPMLWRSSLREACPALDRVLSNSCLHNTFGPLAEVVSTQNRRFH